MCDRCVADSFAQLRGVAACRGEVWAMSVAARCGRSQPWPATDRATAIAQRKIADLTSDTRLAEMLVRELLRWASRWWTTEPQRA
jgi:hypothetical protein